MEPLVVDQTQEEVTPVADLGQAQVSCPACGDPIPVKLRGESGRGADGAVRIVLSLDQEALKQVIDDHVAAAPSLHQARV